MLAISRTIALDSSHWSKWIDASRSKDEEVRKDAQAFGDRLLKRGYSILFSWHHLEELTAHENIDVVRKRINFIKEIPFLSWIGTIGEELELGGITDVFAVEVKAVLAGCSDVSAVRRRAKPLLIRSGAGSKMIFSDPDFADFMFHNSQARLSKARKHTAIMAMPFLDTTQKFGVFRRGKIRPAVERASLFSEQIATLAEFIENRGDSKIKNASQIASEFIREAASGGSLLPQSNPTEFMISAWKLQGIEVNEIRDEMTLEEINDLGVFRSQLRTIAPKTGYAFEELRSRVKPSNFPHKIIEQALKKFSQTPPRWVGSDLNDRYLASISAYTDAVCVDKRTAENFRRVFQKAPEVKVLVDRVIKCSSWTDALRV